MTMVKRTVQIALPSMGEEEWQVMQSHYAKETVPAVSTIQDYQDLKAELKAS